LYTVTTSDGSRTGTGFMVTAFRSVKIAVLTPIPKASANTATP
jgi:hypothetical protein